MIYTCNSTNSTTIVLEGNNSIYVGDDMLDSLMNSIQLENHNVRVDVCLKRFYPGDDLVQTVTFADGMVLLLLYNGILPYLLICRLTK